PSNQTLQLGVGFLLLPFEQSATECWDIKTKDFIDVVKDYYYCWSSWKRLSGANAQTWRVYDLENEDRAIHPDDGLYFMGYKAQRRLKVKARSTLMMGIPNEHQLKFNSIKDAKQLMEAIKKRFGDNATTKKTERNILKQQYEKFTASNSEMLD
nr:ribonuclease H-like domain-containing protein [Tanacetum cinerariifolium]